MHSAIEHAKKHKSLFIMNDWKNVFKSARSQNKTKRKPYEVIELKYKDFMNLQDLANKTIKNKSKDENGNKIDWLKIKCLKYEKKHPGIIFYKYDHNNSEYKRVYAKGRGRPRRETYTLKPAYPQNLPITKKKKADLIKLCDKNIIPEELQAWYKNLPSMNEELEEIAPEPAADENDYEED